MIQSQVIRKEITDADVENVIKICTHKSMTPDREVITFIPEEFTVDGFKESAIHGMMGSDLKCVAFFIQDLVQSYNLRKTVERRVTSWKTSSFHRLRWVKNSLNEGERTWATVIDMGGLTMVASVRSQELQFTNISKKVAIRLPKIFLLKTSSKLAEGLKFNYGGLCRLAEMKSSMWSHRSR